MLLAFFRSDEQLLQRQIQWILDPVAPGSALDVAGIHYFYLCCAREVEFHPLLLQFDKILLTSFFVCSIVFNKHTPSPSWLPEGSMPDWVTMVSLAASFASYWAIPRIDRDPEPTITFGIGKHRYQL